MLPSSKGLLSDNHPPLCARISPFRIRQIYFRTYLITVERRLSERQSSETSNIRTHIFFVKIFSAFLFLKKKNTVYSERVAKPAQIARQTAKSLLKENGCLRSNNEKSAITSRNKVLCHFY